MSGVADLESSLSSPPGTSVEPILFFLLSLYLRHRYAKAPTIFSRTIRNNHIVLSGLLVSWKYQSVRVRSQKNYHYHSYICISFH